MQIWLFNIKQVSGCGKSPRTKFIWLGMFANQNQATKNFLINETMNETGRAVHRYLATLREGQSIFYSIEPDVPKNKLEKNVFPSNSSNNFRFIRDTATRTFGGEKYLLIH